MSNHNEEEFEYEADLADIELSNELLEMEELEEAKKNKALLMKNIDNIWGYTTKGLEAKEAAMSMLSTKTGMYARIPLLCKEEACPYAKTCKILEYNLTTYGEPCVVETSQIELRYTGYEQDFDLENASFTDKILITDLIHQDIMLERCKTLLSDDGVLVQDVFAGVSEEGEVFTRPEVSKNWEAYERVLKKRNEIYDLFVATRKSKKAFKDEGGDSNSIYTTIKEMVDVDFVEDVKPDNIE